MNKLNVRPLVVTLAASLVLVAIALLVWTRTASPRKVAERIAIAWAVGDLPAILKHSPPGERKHVSTEALSRLHAETFTDELAGLSVVQVKQQGESTPVSRRIKHTYTATYRTPKGVEFEVDIELFENQEGLSCGVLATLFAIYTAHALSTGGYDGSYRSFVEVHAPAQARIADIVRRCGISHVYDPVDGRLIPLSEFGA